MNDAEVSEYSRLISRTVNKFSSNLELLFEILAS